MASTPPSLCPSFCPSDCSFTHHPLLLTLLDCCDLEPGQEREDAFSSLKTIITKYEKSNKWSKDSVIPDQYEAYRFPMIHWACAVGQPYVVEWLVKQGFSSAVQHGVSGDTGLHRVFVCMQKSNTNDPEKTINTMLPFLSDCFTVKNKLGNNPFQLACELLNADTTLKNNKFFANCIIFMIETAKIVDNSCDLLLEMLNSQNSNGDTGIHILAQHDRNLASLKICVREGGSVMLKNKLEINALEVAINCGQTKNSKFLDAELKRQKSCLDPNSLPKPCLLSKVKSLSVCRDRGGSSDSEKPSTSTDVDEIKILPRLRKKRKRLSYDSESSDVSQQSVNYVSTSRVEATSTSKSGDHNSVTLEEGDRTMFTDSAEIDVGKGFLSYLQHTGTETKKAIINTVNTDRIKILQDINECTELTNGYHERRQLLVQQRDVKHQILSRKLEEVMDLQQEINDVENKLTLLDNMHENAPEKITKLTKKLKSCDLALNELQVLSSTSGRIVVE